LVEKASFHSEKCIDTTYLKRKKADASIRSICLPVFIVYHKGIEVEKLLFVSVIFTIYLSVLF